MTASGHTPTGLYKQPWFPGCSVAGLRPLSVSSWIWIAVRQDPLPFTVSQSSLKFQVSTESVMPSNHLILCCSLLLLPSVSPSSRVFSNKLALCIRWLKYWSFTLSISPSNECSGLVSFRMDWLGLLKGLSRVFSSTAIWKHQFFSTQTSLQSSSHIHMWLLEKP